MTPLLGIEKCVIGTIAYMTEIHYYVSKMFVSTLTEVQAVFYFVCQISFYLLADEKILSKRSGRESAPVLTVKERAED